MITSTVIRPAADRTGPATPSRPVSPTLPPDLALEGVRRLRWVAALSMGAGLFFTAVGLLAPVDLSATARSLGLAASLLSIPLAAAVVFVASNPRLNPRTVLDLALVYEVVDALLISLADPRVPLTKENALGAWSGVAVLVLVFPILIPNTRGKVILATLAAAAMDPIGKLIHIALGAPVSPPDAMAFAFAPTALAVVLAIALSRIVYRISVEASRAKELGSYRLVEPLGSGGMGEVWRAEHVMLARPAAIKLIRTDSSTGPSRETQRRFEREARATARLSSPHTVQIYDYGTTDEGTFYYVMELLDGFDLDTLVKEFGPLQPERAIYLLRQACDSLAEAHARSLIHRDIKPANIYVCQYGIDVDFVKVLDFGLVKAAGALEGLDKTLTAAGTIAGTPGYMAPEMALGRGVGSSADIYSLGCVGYWLLTGRPVFERETPVELLIDHAHTPPPRLSERATIALPDGLEEILLSCLEKDPVHRPISAEELAAALEKIAIAEPWSAERARAWWREHPHRARVAEEAPTEAIDEATPRVGRAR